MSNSAHDPAPDAPNRIAFDPVTFLRRPLETVGFWAAVALPFLYVPLLVAGPETDAERVAVFALIAVHAVALLLGHAHNRD
ncbi:MAG: hypothetical protein ABEJ70_08660 [Halobacteriaceae archaeon]